MKNKTGKLTLLLNNPTLPPLNLSGGVNLVPPLKLRGGRGSYEQWVMKTYD